MSVPNRAGAHRALAHDYSGMSNEQLKGMHDQAVNNPHIDKYSARVQGVSAEIVRRNQAPKSYPSGMQGSPTGKMNHS